MSRRSNTYLHPLIYRTIVFLVLVYLGAAWGFFLAAYTGYLLTVVSGLFLISLGSVRILMRIGAKQERRRFVGSIFDWLQGDFETWQYRQRGWDGAILLLLPLAAVAIGMVALVVTFRLVT